jgi:Ca2+-binding RTX toxin-like protein
MAVETGTIVAESVDEEGAPLPGGCYVIEGPEYPVEVCDNDAGDADATPGRVEFQDLLPGDWLIVEVHVPDGYQPARDQVVSLQPGATVLVVFEHDPNDPDIAYEAQPPDPPYQPVEVTPPTRLDIDLTPTCGGVKATIVAATSATGAPTKIVGTEGDDVIVGTAGPDLIAGLGGHDRICSLDGADIIGGGDEDDWLEGGAGDDAIAGGAGIDHLDGGPGKRDACDGGGGSDTATGCETTVAIP